MVYRTIIDVILHLFIICNDLWCQLPFFSQTFRHNGSAVFGTMPPMCRSCPDVNKLQGMETTILGQHRPFMSIKSFVQHSGWQEMVSLCSLIRLIGVCADRDQPEFLCSRSDSRHLEVHVATAGGWLTLYRPREVRNSIYRYRKIHIDYRSKFLYRFISPISIIYGNTSIEYSAWQMCVRDRKHSTSTWGISTSGAWLPGEESAPEWITVPGIAHLNPMEPERMLHTGLRKNPGGLSAHVHTLELQHQRYHEEPHKPMDRGDCQGSQHSSWSSVRPCDSAWGPSVFSFMGVQLSGGSTWHPVSGILEVIWGLPEFVPVRHGLYCWGHVDTGSSGGCTTRSGSRASSPTSIAYTICVYAATATTFLMKITWLLAGIFMYGAE